jgi:acetoacetyl-CoA synthetase
MGTGEFYGVLDGEPTVADALVIDTTSVATPTGRLVLIVQPADGVKVDDAFESNIRSVLRTGLSPRHSPDDIVSVARLAHTLNGKRLEVPAKRLFAGAPLAEVIDINAVDDPDALRLLAATSAAWRSSRASSD